MDSAEMERSAAFARAYEPVGLGAQQQGWEFEEDPWLLTFTLARPASEGAAGRIQDEPRTARLDLGR